MKYLQSTSVGAAGAHRSTQSADTQYYPANAVGLVARMTTHVLTAKMTTVQRQTLHANYFRQLAPADQAMYLFAVAYDLGIMMKLAGNSLSSAALAACLRSELTCNAAGVLVTPLLLDHKAAVKEAMKELNALIVLQVSNNATFQQAMESGAIGSFVGDVRQ